MASQLGQAVGGVPPHFDLADRHYGGRVSFLSSKREHRGHVARTTSRGVRVEVDPECRKPNSPASPTSPASAVSAASATSSIPSKSNQYKPNTPCPSPCSPDDKPSSLSGLSVCPFPHPLHLARRVRPPRPTSHAQPPRRGQCRHQGSRRRWGTAAHGPRREHPSGSGRGIGTHDPPLA
jgi:hypothetical protein